GRYEDHVQEPALAFIEDFGYRLESISPHFRADTRKTGGSLFRIYRDTRFSKDKTPYKTNTGMHFRHERAKDAHAPGFYLHLAPDEVFGGAGIWHPDTKTANRIRQAILDDPDGWREATRTPPFTDRMDLGGHDNMLKRVPPGLPADHEFADDFRRRDYFGWAATTETTVTADGFLDEYTRMCEAAAPLVRFICRALDLEF
ncbi:MAG TPA: TIGR02453 family protein, partial [Solirubrobacteraceae bacterium]|nr:TIGR02453 family protein [Solirubrobacteraceae bacterium]